MPQLEDNLFKAIGFTYFGPFDGHDIPELLRVLSIAKQLKGPVLIHIYTTKGKGFAPAELDPVGYHAISKLPVETENEAQSKATEASDITAASTSNNETCFEILASIWAVFM